MDVHFGALCPKLIEQVGDLPSIDQFQKDADAIVRLYLRGLIPDKIKQDCNKKLFKKIEKEYCERNNMTPVHKSSFDYEAEALIKQSEVKENEQDKHAEGSDT